MTTHRFSIGTCFQWHGEKYRIDRLLEGGRLNLENMRTEVVCSEHMSVLVRALFKGELVFDDRKEAGSKNKKSSVEEVGRERKEVKEGDDPPFQYKCLELEDYPPHLVEIARYRLEVIRPLLEPLEVAEAVGSPAELNRRPNEHGEHSGGSRNSTSDSGHRRSKHDKRSRYGNHSTHMIGSINARIEQCRQQLSVSSRSGGDQEKQEGQEGQDRPPGRSGRGETERTLLSSLSVISAYRWLRAYTESGNDLRSLIPNTRSRGGKGQSRIEPQVNALIESVLRENLKRETYTVDDALNEVSARIEDNNARVSPEERLVVPSRRTIFRRNEDLDIMERYEAKHGRYAARRQFAQYGRMIELELPGEMAEIDHTRPDLIVVDPVDLLPLGKLNFTYGIDVATRLPWGFYLGFERASYYAVAECLYHMICPKEGVQLLYGTANPWRMCGIPGTLLTDNGKEFTGRHLRDACDLLGINLKHAPVRAPHRKPHVERFFGTINTGLFHIAPGTTFSDPKHRGDYHSEKLACICLDDLVRMLHIFLLDEYSQKRHRSLSCSPAQRWEQVADGFLPRLPASADEIHILLGRSERRRLWHYGIDLDCIRYQHEDLALLRAQLKEGEQVKIKYTPGDLGAIHVFNPFEGCYIKVPALDGEYAEGLSLWKHRIIKRQAMLDEGKNDLAALGRARRKLQEIIDSARHRKNALKGARLGRWKGYGTGRTEQSGSVLPVNPIKGIGTRSHSAMDIPDAHSASRGRRASRASRASSSANSSAASPLLPASRLGQAGSSPPLAPWSLPMSLLEIEADLAADEQAAKDAGWRVLSNNTNTSNEELD